MTHWAVGESLPPSFTIWAVRRLAGSQGGLLHRSCHWQGKCQALGAVATERCPGPAWQWNIPGLVMGLTMYPLVMTNIAMV